GPRSGQRSGKYLQGCTETIQRSRRSPKGKGPERRDSSRCDPHTGSDVVSCESSRIVRRRDCGASAETGPKYRHARTHATRARCQCRDRKSTRLNSSHVEISYAVFCLKKKKKRSNQHIPLNHTTQDHN